VTLLEPTSGSTAASKLIPYTHGLKREFERGIAPWMVTSSVESPAPVRPGLLVGLAGGAAAGPHGRRSPDRFDDDADYLGGAQRRLVQRVMAVPAAVRLVEDMAAFRYVTLFFLLRARSLALISVWSPTFLSLLVRALARVVVAAGRTTPRRRDAHRARRRCTPDVRRRCWRTSGRTPAPGSGSRQA
jgi:hypothetical protein